MDLLQGLKGFFTRKSPLSSRGYNAASRNNFTGINPVHSNIVTNSIDNQVRAQLRVILEAFPKNDFVKSTKAKGVLDELRRKLDETRYSQILNDELNRNRTSSNLSELSNADLANISEIAKAKVGGRRKRSRKNCKATRRNRRNHKATRRN